MSRLSVKAPPAYRSANHSPAAGGDTTIVTPRTARIRRPVIRAIASSLLWPLPPAAGPEDRRMSTAEVIEEPLGQVRGAAPTLPPLTARFEWREIGRASCRERV